MEAEADVREENPCSSTTLSMESTELAQSNNPQHCLSSEGPQQRSPPGQGANLDIESETETFSSLLERSLSVILFIASQNLELDLSSESVEDDSGLFQSTLELLSRYDPVLQQHFDLVKCSGNTGDTLQSRYLSQSTQIEFISLCGKRVVDAIAAERKKAIYFSVIFDVTDALGMYQNVVTVRYMHRNPATGHWGLQERFLKCFDGFSKKSCDEVTEILLSGLHEHGIDVKHCRGLGYYNGANMVHKLNQVRACIEERYPAAISCPCAICFLNIVGAHAASCCAELSSFFGYVTYLYKFFSARPDRWCILTEETGCRLLRGSDTMWIARIEAIRPIAEKLPRLIDALERCEEYFESEFLIDYFLSFNSILLATLWVKILYSFEEHNNIPQSKSTSMEIWAAHIKALSADLQALREQWPEVLSEASQVADDMEVPKDLKPEDAKFRRPDDQVLEGDAETFFKVNVFHVTLDAITAELNRCFHSMENINSLFAPLLRFRSMPEDELVASTAALVRKYPQDLSPALLIELQHLREVYDATFKNNLEPLQLLNAINSRGLDDLFAELCVAIRIFATLPLSVPEGDTFSKQDLIKNYLCSKMSEQHMDGLAFLSIEHELAKQLDFKDLMRDFASTKLRIWSDL